MISHLAIYSLIEVEISANWLVCSKFLTVTDTCLEWIFSITPMITLSLLLMSQPYLIFDIFFCIHMICYAYMLSFSIQIFWIINHLRFCNPVLQYTDDKCHQEPSAEKCNKEPLKEKSHQESKESINGMVNFI